MTAASALSCTFNMHACILPFPMGSSMFVSALCPCPRSAKNIMDSVSLLTCTFGLSIIAPTKAKVRKIKGASALTPSSKRTKRAGSDRLATTMNQSNDEQVPVAVHQDFSQKLDAVMTMITDLSTHVTAYKGHQKQGEPSFTSSPLTSLPRWRARHQGELAPSPRYTSGGPEEHG